MFFGIRAISELNANRSGATDGVLFNARHRCDAHLHLHLHLPVWRAVGR